MAEVNATRNENGLEKDNKETYVSLTDSLFKIRWANHKQSFEKPELKNATELSKCIWKLKEQKVNHSIKWRIIDKAPSYTNKTKKCRLCTLEKYFILCKPKILRFSFHKECPRVTF